MLEGLVFGWRTAVLTVAATQLLVLAAALVRTLANRAANRTLAALLVVMVLIFTPWLIGFAGFYDKWRWLTFAPFQITLAPAPLCWLYLRALTESTLPPRWRRHLVPAAIQALYLATCFLLPLPAKMAWFDASSPLYEIVLAILLIGQIGWYGRDSLFRLRSYRALLGHHVADTQRYAGRWLASALAALGGLFVIWSAYLVWDLFSPLGYKGLMGLYLAMAGVSLYLGIEGWRHAALSFPRLAELELPAASEPRDWSALGAKWAEQVRTEGWARDPDLTIVRLARRLGTNTGYLSRAINLGLGTNFAGFIAAERAEAVAARLRAGDRADLLTIALEEGFGSKASFNRAFAGSFGEAPSAYRRRVSNSENIG